MIKFKKLDDSILFALLGVFLVTEIIDDIFDYLLGSSIIHSIIQLFFFIFLFLIVTKIFFKYHKKKINVLIPNELMNILIVINNEKEKGVLVNQVELMKLLDITKPTIKKRLDQLIAFDYVYFEENGNNKYIKLTPLGLLIIK